MKFIVSLKKLQIENNIFLIETLLFIGYLKLVVIQNHLRIIFQVQLSV